MSFIQKLENNIVFRGLLNVQNVILIVTTILAGGVVFAGVVLRYVMQSNFFGQEEIIAVIAMWMYWVGGIYGSYENSHIKGDMLSSFFKSAKVKKGIELVIHLISFVVILFFIRWGCEYMAFNLKFSAVSTGLKIPMAWSQWPLLIGFIFMELYTVFTFFRVLLDKDFGKDPEPENVEEDAA